MPRRILLHILCSCVVAQFSNTRRCRRKVGQETGEEKANRLWAQEAETNAQKLCNHLEASCDASWSPFKHANTPSPQLKAWEANGFQEFGLGTVEPGGPLEEYKELLSTGLQTQQLVSNSNPTPRALNPKPKSKAQLAKGHASSSGVGPELALQAERPQHKPTFMAERLQGMR